MLPHFHLYFCFGHKFLNLLLSLSKSVGFPAAYMQAELQTNPYESLASPHLRTSQVKTSTSSYFGVIFAMLEMSF